MRTDHLQLSPEQARQRLRASEARPLGSGRDRRVHALGTAVFGLTSAFYVASQNVMSQSTRVALGVVFVIAWLAEAAWVERAARTVPRRARRWSRIGVGASFALALGVVLPFLNLRNQDAPNSWPLVLAAALVIAVPSLVAAAVIARGGR